MPGAAGGGQRTQWVCIGPNAYKGQEARKRDIDNLTAALAQVRHEEAFMRAVSPAQLAGWNRNEYYKTEEEFRIAIADALREECKAIIDDPQLASHYTTRPELDIAQCRNVASATLELLNHALAGIPTERVRYHTCYGIDMGPRVRDLELKHIIDIMLRINAGAFRFAVRVDRCSARRGSPREISMIDTRRSEPGLHNRLNPTNLAPCIKSAP